MFEIKVSGSSYEEFKKNLKIACMDILREEESDVSLNQGPIKVETVDESPVTPIKEESNERQKSKRKRRKEEVIASPSQVDQASSDIKNTSSDEAEVSIEDLKELKTKKSKLPKIEVPTPATNAAYYNRDEFKSLWTKVYKEKGKEVALSVLHFFNVTHGRDLSDTDLQKACIKCVDILSEGLNVPR